MLQQRIVSVTNQDSYKGGAVLYWMDREMRFSDNWAFAYAVEQSKSLGVPLYVVYTLVVDFLGGGARQLAFKIQGLRDLEATASKRGIAFTVLMSQQRGNEVQDLVAWMKRYDVGLVVTDMSPLRIQRQWKSALAKKSGCPLYCIDAHNIVPISVASDKREYGAYTIRPKLYKLLPTYMDELPRLIVPQHIGVLLPSIDWSAIEKALHNAGGAEPVSWCAGGEHTAKKRLALWCDTGVLSYGTMRNDAVVRGQSDLSPYLHYGMLAPQRVVRDVLRAHNLSLVDCITKHKNSADVDSTKALSVRDHVSAFLEELIVRRELADNFCWYTPQYDSVEAFPEWAQKSLQQALTDARQYTYTKKQFELAETHDPLWNASQKELVRTGKMHGYMRMYWAKKILEWTPSPQEALRIAIYLNDAYELDGRDPNGYAGIAWSIGGVHDRAWFPRPIFGTVRYMAESGCRKKYDVDAYIQLQEKSLFT